MSNREFLRRIIYPFTAIVGLEKAKQALLVVSVNPLIGGVLLRGDKGTGKTTLVRALANVLPEIEVVKDCPFNCNPSNPMEMCDNCYRRWLNGDKLPIIKKKMRVIDLPLSITPDRLIGTIDIERALREGVKALKPGILAEANRNILYIDEVNLLDDYIADLILDAAAYGWNIIEREHISFKHPSKFILIGSMNPEEGELRPQLLDRFGLVVNVEAPMEPETRAEIVRRVEEFSIDPVSFYKKYEAKERELRERIIQARELLPRVSIDDDLLRMLTKTLVEMKIRTCRAEITIVRTAKALAALDNRTHVTMDDLKKAMELALPHRSSLKPFGQKQYSNFPNNKHKDHRHEESHKHISSSSNQIQENEGHNFSVRLMKSNKLNTNKPGEKTIVIPPIENDLSITENTIKRVEKNSSYIKGSRYTYSTVVNKPYGIPISYAYPIHNPIDIDVIGTMVNLFVNKLRIEDLTKDNLLSEILAVRIRRMRVPELVVIALDASGSMNVFKRIAIAKKIAQELVENSYTKRAWISLIVFRGNDVELYIPITRSYSKVVELLSKLPTGGKTPLSAGLKKIIETAKVFRTKYRNSRITAILITDGKANKPLYTDIDEEISLYSKLISKENIDLIIYDTRPRGIDPSISYIDKIALITNAKVYKI